MPCQPLGVTPRGEFGIGSLTDGNFLARQAVSWVQGMKHDTEN